MVVNTYPVANNELTSLTSLLKVSEKWMYYIDKLICTEVLITIVLRRFNIRMKVQVAGIAVWIRVEGSVSLKFSGLTSHL